METLAAHHCLVATSLRCAPHHWRVLNSIFSVPILKLLALLALMSVSNLILSTYILTMIELLYTYMKKSLIEVIRFLFWEHSVISNWATFIEKSQQHCLASKRTREAKTWWWLPPPAAFVPLSTDRKCFLLRVCQDGRATFQPFEISAAHTVRGHPARCF